jgi:16S rRNA (cytosine1402-N4)-methyltransferase
VADLHVPVLVAEVVEALVRRPDGTYADGTTGTGGHAEAILHALSPQGRLICVDQDPDALDVARGRLGEQGGRVSYHRGSFHELGAAFAAVGVSAVDGILLDLGLNSWSLAQVGKGLSYSVDGPLRMDLDPDGGRTAADFLATASFDELVRVFTEYGDVRRPRLFARRILEARRRRPLRTTGDLVRALVGEAPGSVGADEFSRLFQAIRVEIGLEMERLERFLERAADWIVPDGRLVVISYASHEDRRVKGLTRRGEGSPGAFRPLLRSPLRPGEEEVHRNRRARSARMRCFERRGA